MIDIHSHIVFDVDDGPDTLEESLALIKESYSQGVRTIVSTSHRRKGMFETPEEKIFTNFSVVKEEVEKIYDDLTLCFGGELYYSNDIPEKLSKNQVPRMNGTRFALVEFSMTTPWKEIHTGLSQVLMQGVTPIVAHIERYNALEFNKERVKELIDMGCYTQINSSHVLKPKLFGDKYKVFKKRARYFLEENLVHCVASDMHNTGERKPYMKEAYQIIFKDFGKKRAHDLFKDNPQTLLENNYL
ncbi:MAG: capsular polysaccharide biosynthesis protein Cps4B [Streptococcus orisratti]|uniref:Tyrosine-protein phosphatase n=1 Tax=Streptococcus suis TaxID=1307 RepID=M1VE58_STRSU|nr:capsular polysaccharide biosynthesis protein Cps4B [Streptococcus orisratti]MDY5635727.1 capsular polysaccharide biosynthesis protein Cps4B [Streptococcus orisratti]BAM95150.1 protein-tyrosine phosphatase [Streptococcus suis]